MALITCPECKHDVSNYAHSCPHCGYPISELLKEANGDANEQKLEINQYSVVLISTNDRPCNASRAYDESGLDIPIKEWLEIEKHTPAVLKTNLTHEEAQAIYDVFDRRKLSVRIIDNPEDLKHYWIYKDEPEPIDDILRCPRCKSTAITTGSRGFSLVWGFLGSGSTVNRCGKCGYKWEPKK